jgi:hypothetical protein
MKNTLASAETKLADTREKAVSDIKSRLQVEEITRDIKTAAIEQVKQDLLKALQGQLGLVAPKITDTTAQMVSLQDKINSLKNSYNHILVVDQEIKGIGVEISSIDIGDSYSPRVKPGDMMNISITLKASEEGHYGAQENKHVVVDIEAEFMNVANRISNYDLYVGVEQRRRYRFQFLQSYPEPNLRLASTPRR